MTLRMSDETERGQITAKEMVRRVLALLRHHERMMTLSASAPRG